MDLNTLWQEHKAFILSVLAGLLVFIVGQAAISSVYSTDAKRRSVTSLDRSLRQVKAPTSSELTEIRKLNAELTERFEDTVRKVVFVPDPKYILSSTEKPDIQYDRLYNEARDTLVEGAKALNITVDPSLGMPELSPTRHGEIQKALTALDMVTRVVIIALETQVGYIESITMVPEKGRVSKTMVREQRVRFKMTGKAASIAEFFQQFARQEHFLSIEKAQLKTGDGKRNAQDGSTVSADFVISALTIINEESQS